MASKDTHKLMLNHSQAKVKLYGSYLAKYLNIISQDGYTQRIHVYDLFSGEGVYEDGGKGSPIIALDELQNHYQLRSGAQPRISVTFNDIDPKAITRLKGAISERTVPGNCTIRVLNDDYKKLLGTVTSEIASFGNEKAVIFLDPKGYKEIQISDISRLLANRKTEVLVFLPIRDMFRFANSVDGELQPGFEPLHRFITEIFPDTIPTFSSQLDFVEKIKSGLREKLPGYFVDTFTLERESGQFFCLFFFTTHIKGFEKMLDTKWELDTEQGRGWHYERSMGIFSQVEVTGFADQLSAFLRETRRYNGEVYEFSLHCGFLPKQVNEILRDFQQNGTLTVYEQNGKEARKNSFYLSYDNYKNSPRRVYFQMN